MRDEKINKKRTTLGNSQKGSGSGNRERGRKGDEGDKVDRFN